MKRAGFTLIELIVAVAILSVIMAAVGGLYAASITAARQSIQNIEANEAGRTAFGLIERDLNAAFTARDYGDLYQFYGTPIGFSFVGLTRAYKSESSTPNLGRVTYVLHPTELAEGEAIEIVDAAVTDLAIVRANEGLSPEEQESPEDIKEAYVITCSLVRYYEPGRSDLETFPLDWQKLRFGEDTNYTGDEEYGTGYAIVDQEFTAIEGLANVGWGAEIIEPLVQAKKRQFWMRLLSGAEGQNYAGADRLPRWFDEPPIPGDTTGYVPETGLEPYDYEAGDFLVAQNILLGYVLREWVDKEAAYQNVDPADFVAELVYDWLRFPLDGDENIDEHYYLPDNYEAGLMIDSDEAASGATSAYYVQPAVRKRLEFTYGVADTGHTVYSPWWNADGSIPSTHAFTDFNSLEDIDAAANSSAGIRALNPATPVLQYPDPDAVHPFDPSGPLPPNNPDAVQADWDSFVYPFGMYQDEALFPWTDVEEDQDDPELHHPVWRMFPGGAEEFNERGFRLRSRMITQIGTPFTPRLPELVRVRGIMRWESPAIGAAELTREFDFVIDVPSGAVRTKWWSPST